MHSDKQNRKPDREQGESVNKMQIRKLINCLTDQDRAMQEKCYVFGKQWKEILCRRRVRPLHDIQKPCPFTLTEANGGPPHRHVLLALRRCDCWRGCGTAVCLCAGGWSRAMKRRVLALPYWIETCLRSPLTCLQVIVWANRVYNRISGSLCRFSRTEMWRGSPLSHFNLRRRMTCRRNDPLLHEIPDGGCRLQRSNWRKRGPSA